MSALTLIGAVMAGVRVIVCPRCNGLGEVGLSSFRCTCPRCLGCGESTNGININPTGVQQ